MKSTKKIAQEWIEATKGNGPEYVNRWPHAAKMYVRMTLLKVVQGVGPSDSSRATKRKLTTKK